MGLKKRLGTAVRAFMNPALRQPRPVPPPEPTRIVVDRLMEGRRCLVTGAGRNIGKSIATELMAHGADVYATEVDADRCASLEAELARHPGKSGVFRADVTRAEDTDAMLKSLDARGVAIDLLVNNVGIVVDDFTRSFDTNVVGPVRLTNAIAQRMIDAKTPGSIVFLSSIHQESLFTRAKAYAASKAAIAMIIRQMAVELAPHRIRVNGVAPGDVREDEDGDVVPYGYTPLEGTSIRPQYIARAVLYLASDYFSRYTTGSTITIDAGLSLFNYQAAFDMGLFP